MWNQAVPGSVRRERLPWGFLKSDPMVRVKSQ
jgi:hypothetical protein